MLVKVRIQEPPARIPCSLTNLLSLAKTNTVPSESNINAGNPKYNLKWSRILEKSNPDGAAAPPILNPISTTANGGGLPETELSPAIIRI